VATFSTILGLKLNDSSDPFQLSDFTSNYEILDANPGVFICASSGRPSWGAAQAGRLIFMTDLKQLSFWNGAAWSDLRDSAPVFAGGVFLGANMSPSTSPVFNVLTFTTSRPSALAIWASGTYNCANNKTQDAYQSVLIDGASAGIGNFREQVRFEGNSGDTGALAGMNALSIGLVPSVAAGQHKIGIKVDMGTYPVSVEMAGIKIMAMIALYASNNML
jgi:hypothetical protein